VAVQISGEKDLGKFQGGDRRELCPRDSSEGMRNRGVGKRVRFSKREKKKKNSDKKVNNLHLGNGGDEPM